MHNVVIIDALRSPIGKFGGTLASISAQELGRQCLHALCERVAQKKSCAIEAVHALIEEVIIGNVLSAGLGQNVARQIVLQGGLSNTIPATTINMVCGSSLKAVIIASQLIMLGERKTMIAGGTESMSRAPYLVEGLRWGKKYGNDVLVDSIVKDGLSDAMHKYAMGITGENVATQWNISRALQDEFAYHSQMKVKDAESAAYFDDERITLQVTHKSNTSYIDQDEFPRADTTLEALAKLKPVFDAEGSITAGNASGINDGAAMIFLMEEKEATQQQLPVLCRILSTSTVALDETIMGYGPYFAIKDLLEKNNLTVDDIHYYEINEAFASQCLAVINDLALNKEKVNPLGGAIALGHPIGASGARILTTLAHALYRETKRLRTSLKGIATLCVGGGQACGILIESVVP